MTSTKSACAKKGVTVTDISESHPTTPQNINVSDMDAAMQKLHTKFGKSEDSVGAPPRTPQSGFYPWEIDPTKLSLRQRIGQGSFGTVHRGTYDGEDVAVKILTWGYGEISPSDREYHRQAFLQEVEVMSKLKHPNITAFVGAYLGGKEYTIPSVDFAHERNQYKIKDSTCILLMEYVASGSLRSIWVNSRRAGKRRLPFRLVYQLALDTARGLAYLHERKVCHRDLKPDNLLLGDDMRVKIADFGESRIEAEDPANMSRRVGTYVYMAPEVLDPNPENPAAGYDHKCDVFSYAICMWELYASDFPFPDLNVRDITAAVVEERLRPRIPACCPTFFSKLIRRCWDPNPKGRPEMKEVIKILEDNDPNTCGIRVQATCESVFLTCGLPC